MQFYKGRGIFYAVAKLSIKFDKLTVLFQQSFNNFYRNYCIAFLHISTQLIEIYTEKQCVQLWKVTLKGTAATSFKTTIFLVKE